MPVPHLISTAISASMEMGMNALLRLDPAHRDALKPLVGRVLSVEVPKLLTKRYFCFSEQEIIVLEQMGEEPDCALSLMLSALPKLKDSQQLGELIKSEQLSIVGDIKLAQHFSDLLTQVNIDIEELLSHKIGDALAHSLVYNTSQLFHSLKHRAQSIAEDAQEVLTHEWRLGPSTLELELWKEDIAQLEQELTQLEKRVAEITGR